MESPEDPQGQLLETCPFCGYSLAGLPVEHRCPECGLAFDRRWELFGHSPRMTLRKRMQRWFAVGLFLFSVPWAIAEAAKRNTTASLFFAVLAAGMLWIVFHRPAVFVAVGPSGVTVAERRKRRTTSYPWADIRGARLVHGEVVLALDGREERLGLVNDAGEDASWCVDCISSHLKPDELNA